MRRPTLLLAATAALLALAACGSDDSGSDTTDATEPPDVTTTVPDGGDVPAEIVGVHWVLEGTYTVGGLQPLPVETTAGLTFADDGTVAIDTGCNHGSATAAFDGDELQIGTITITEKACLDEDVTRIEQTLLGQLERPQHWGVTDDALTMFAVNISDTGMRFRDASAPPGVDEADQTSTT